MLTPSTSVVKVYGVNIGPAVGLPRFKDAEFEIRETPAIVQIKMLY